MKAEAKENLLVGMACFIAFACVSVTYVVMHAITQEIRAFKKDIKNNSSIWYKNNITPIEDDTLIDCDYDFFVREDDNVKCTVHTENKAPINLVCNKDFCYKD